ncbi:glycosyltransferase [Natronospirillum operosum]|uniref:glycosyltransferase n=1 Tax=Natronospirillum operosum TaxID=2759953 RepID=UPI0014367BDE|nr:glycosyltransferase [Natronospirillum operosum]
MKKILYIVSTLNNSGPTNQLYNIIKYLDRSQFEPNLITLSPESVDSRWTDYEKLGVNLYSLNLSRIVGVFLGKIRLSKKIYEIGPDLLHTQGIRSDMLSASLEVRIPRVATIRNFPQHDYTMTYGKSQSMFMLWKHPRAWKKLDLCVGVSEAVSKNLADQFDICDVETVPNGVDTEIYQKVSQADKIELRRNLKLSESADIWVSSGHLSERKDPLLIIATWKEIFANDPASHLIFIGDGSVRGECETASADCPNIHFCGRVSNVSDYLQASDYFISASKAEGLPNAVLEAIACGLPVVLSDIAPHREIWGMSPDIGELFDLGDKESLKSAFNLMKEKNADTQYEATQSLVEEKLSAQVMSKCYQSIYKRLISGEAQ